MKKLYVNFSVMKIIRRALLLNFALVVPFLLTWSSYFSVKSLMWEINWKNCSIICSSYYLVFGFLEHKMSLFKMSEMKLFIQVTLPLVIPVVKITVSYVFCLFAQLYFRPRHEENRSMRLSRKRKRTEVVKGQEITRWRVWRIDVKQKRKSFSVRGGKEEGRGRGRVTGCMGILSHKAFMSDQS